MPRAGVSTRVSARGYPVGCRNLGRARLLAGILISPVVPGRLGATVPTGRPRRSDTCSNRGAITTSGDVTFGLAVHRRRATPDRGTRGPAGLFATFFADRHNQPETRPAVGPCGASRQPRGGPDGRLNPDSSYNAETARAMGLDSSQAGNSRGGDTEANVPEPLLQQGPAEKSALVTSRRDLIRCRIARYLAAVAFRYTFCTI